MPVGQKHHQRVAVTMTIGFGRFDFKAKDDLEKVRLICGTECKEYVALKEVIDGTRTY